MACVQELEKEFRTGRERKSQHKHYHIPNRGELTVKYALEDDKQYRVLPDPARKSHFHTSFLS